MPKILIIEENSRVSGIISRFLENKGYGTVIAADGISAMRSFVAEPFDMLLVNMELQLLSGDEVCRKVRESAKGRDIPIIMMSGMLKNQQKIDDLKRELGLSGFLVKPFTSEILTNVLTAALPALSAAPPQHFPDPPQEHSPEPSAQVAPDLYEPREYKPSTEEAAPAPDLHEAQEYRPPVQEDILPPELEEPREYRPPVQEPEAPAPQPELKLQQTEAGKGRQKPEGGAPRPDPMKGHLEGTPFEKVLFFLFKKKGTGTLSVTREKVTRDFFFIDGGVVDVHIAPEDNDFGAYLLSKGMIEEVEFREYKERRMKEGTDGRDLFIKMGCLTPRQFLDESRNFLYDRLLECFSWKNGSVIFEWAQPFMASYAIGPAFMPLVFYRGFKAKLMPDEITAFLKKKSGKYAGRTPSFYEFQNHLAGEGAVADVMDVIDGKRTGKDIVGSRDENDAGLILYTLEYLDLIVFTDKPQTAEIAPSFPIRERRRQPAKEADAETFEDLGGELNALSEELSSLGVIKEEAQQQAAPAAQAQLSPLEQELKDKWESVKTKNYYEMFGMTPKTFTFDKLKKGYFEYTRTYGPDKFFASSSDIMNLAEELLSKISNAYETLSNVVSKEGYDEMLSTQEQVPSAADDKAFYEQVQFQSGKVFVDQGQYESAEKAFQNCVNIDPSKPEYLAFLALAIYHNPAHKGNPAEKKRAKDMVNKSLTLGKLSIAYALKGTIYLDEGGLNFAEAEFNKALKLNPNNKTAQKKLAEIKAKREEEKKGVFQRLFK